MSVIKINGITLSSILFEHLRADCDKEGLLLGTVTNVSSESISDAELGHTRTEQVVVVTSYIACEGQYSWYNSAGHVLPDKLNAVLSRNEHKEVIGWYKLRRKCSSSPSLRERVVHASLTKEFREVPAGCFLYLLCTTFSSNNLAAHSFDHTFLASPCNSNALQAIHVEIVNLKDTCQSDYLRSSSGFPDSTSRGSYLDISNTHRSLFISKDGILNTVQAVSHMSSDMCQRLEKLCNDLTKSENRIGALREDVVRLEDDIYMTKRNRTRARMQVAEQERLAAVSAQQQQHYPPQPSERDLIDFDADIASPVLQSASDLIDVPPPSSSRHGSTSPEVDDSGQHARQHKKRPDSVPPSIAEVDLMMMDSDGEENSNKKSSVSPRDSSSTAARECTAPVSSITKEQTAHVGSAGGSRNSATYGHTSYASTPSSLTPSEANWQQTQPAVTSNKLATATPAVSTTTAMKFKKVNADSDVSGLSAPSDHQRVAAGHNLSSTGASSNLKPTVRTYSDAMKELENKRASPLGNGTTVTSGDNNRPLSQQVTLPSVAPTSSTAARQSPLPQQVSESYHTGSGEASPRPGLSSRPTELGQVVDSNGSVQQRQQQPKPLSLTKTGVSYDTTTTVPGSTTTSNTASQFDRTSTARIAVNKSGSNKPGAGVARTKPVERGGSAPKTAASAVIRNGESDEDSADDSVSREEPPRTSSRKPSSKNNKNSPHL